MNKDFFETEVAAALDHLNKGETILYPTDTVWGIGCDATNERAIKRLYQIKERSDQKSMIVLMASEREVYQYVASVDLQVFDFLQHQVKPTTVVFDNAIGLPQNLIQEDGSVAIRIVQDKFCRHLIKRLQKPIVSTSANISGEPTPASFAAINDIIKSRVDHIVKYRQDDEMGATPSQIIKWNRDGTVTYLRK
jgi:L-threonylcarbamoyladenylate synthase